MDEKPHKKSIQLMIFFPPLFFSQNGPALLEINKKTWAAADDLF